MEGKGEKNDVPALVGRAPSEENTLGKKFLHIGEKGDFPAGMSLFPRREGGASSHCLVSTGGKNPGSFDPAI